MVYVVIDEPNVSNQANSGLAVSLSQKIMAEAFPYLNITKVEQEQKNNLTKDLIRYSNNLCEVFCAE